MHFEYRNILFITYSGLIKCLELECDLRVYCFSKFNSNTNIILNFFINYLKYVIIYNQFKYPNNKPFQYFNQIHFLINLQIYDNFSLLDLYNVDFITLKFYSNVQIMNISLNSWNMMERI